MTNFQRTGTERSPGADPAVTALLRAAYAAPSDENYWQSFEKRVMSRINESNQVALWGVFSEWRQAGAIAATVALLLAGFAVARDLQSSSAATSSEYYTIFDDASGDVSVAFEAPNEEATSDEAAERYLDSYYP